MVHIKDPLQGLNFLIYSLVSCIFSLAQIFTVTNMVECTTEYKTQIIIIIIIISASFHFVNSEHFDFKNYITNTFFLLLR